MNLAPAHCGRGCCQATRRPRTEVLGAGLLLTQALTNPFQSYLALQDGAASDFMEEEHAFPKRKAEARKEKGLFQKKEGILGNEKNKSTRVHILGFFCAMCFHFANDQIEQL